MPKGELELIRRIAALLERAAPHNVRTAGDAAAVPFGDDMAAVPFDAPTLLLTTDMLMDGVDFRSAEHPWERIGYKALAVSLSDCAAMAVRPVAALCALSLSNALSMDDAERLMTGVVDCARRFNCPLVGGDTNSWDAPTVVCVTIAARPHDGRPPVRRDGARPGDRLCLSGPVGGSRAGRHLTPNPRIDLALNVSRAAQPHAMIDISDGLALDLWRVLDASACGAVIERARLDPLIHPDAARCAARDGVPALEHALYDGEDFELIVALPPTVDDQRLRELGLTCIGRFVEGRDCTLLEPDGRARPLERRGWEHFR